MTTSEPVIKSQDTTKNIDFEKIFYQLRDNKSLCKVRTVTTFINLTKDIDAWEQVLADAIKQCNSLADAYYLQGYVVQSIRIVTNPFGEYLDTSTIESAVIGLEKITQLLDQLSQDTSTLSDANSIDNQSQPLRIRFAIGEAKTVQEIKLLPQLIAQYGDLCNACVNVPANDLGVLDNELIEHCVETVQHIAKITPRGEGNFNFTVNFNCDEFIPYFPASYHSGQTDKGFVIGLETPDLLVATLQAVNDQHNKQVSKDNVTEGISYQQQRQLAIQAMSYALQHHIDIINKIAQTNSSDSGIRGSETKDSETKVSSTMDWTYIGIDTSAAPSKDCASMVEVYKLLGVPFFGASGTVEASSLLTRVFKSIKGIDAVGFSGLMLAVTEDTGLAQGTIDNEFDIRALLTYSAVCGIGLDTVPIAGDTPNEKLSALMRDTGTMAFRLNKPLTVRVFPVPNLSAGEITQFESDDLCNCAVMAVR